MTLFITIILISFHQIIIVHGDGEDDSQSGEAAVADSDVIPDSSDTDDIPAAVYNRIQTQFGGTTRRFSDLSDMISDSSMSDDECQFRFNPPNLGYMGSQVLISQIRKLDQIITVQLSFHSGNGDIVRDPFGNPIEYASSRQDLGHVLAILHQGFSFSYARCRLRLRPNSNFDPHTLFFHFAQSLLTTTSRNNIAAIITGPTLFSIDGTARTYNVSINCPSGLTCMWLINGDIIVPSANTSVSLTFGQNHIGNRTLSYTGYFQNIPRCLASLLLSILSSARQVCNSLPTTPTNTWLSGGSMNSPRMYFTATYLSTSAYIMITGGTADGWTALSSVDIYDPNTGCSNTSNMTAPRMQHAAAYYNNSDTVILIGGIQGANSSIANSELISFNTAQSYQSMITPRFSHRIAMFNDSNILIVGGRRLDNTIVQFEMYNRTSSSFQSLSSYDIRLTNQLTNTEGHSATSIGSTGLVLIFGGYNGTTYSGTGLIADETNVTSAVVDGEESTIIPGRAHHQATYIPQLEAVLITGGDNGVRAFNDCYLYYPSTSTFNRTGDMLSARSFHTAVLLTNGSVLIVGGALAMGGGQPVTPTPTVEIYDLTTSSFVSVTSLQVARFGHLAIVLPSDEVFVFGGTGTDGSIISSIEYIMPNT